MPNICKTNYNLNLIQSVLFTSGITISVIILIFFLIGTDSDFRVDCRLSHRRSVNFGTGSELCIKNGMDTIFPLSLSYTTSLVFTIFL